MSAVASVEGSNTAFPALAVPEELLAAIVTNPNRASSGVAATTNAAPINLNMHSLWLAGFLDWDTWVLSQSPDPNGNRGVMPGESISCSSGHRRISHLEWLSLSRVRAESGPLSRPSNQRAGEGVGSFSSRRSFRAGSNWRHRERCLPVQGALPRVPVGLT